MCTDTTPSHHRCCRRRLCWWPHSTPHPPATFPHPCQGKVSTELFPVSTPIDPNWCGGIEWGREEDRPERTGMGRGYADEAKTEAAVAFISSAAQYGPVNEPFLYVPDTLYELIIFFRCPTAPGWCLAGPWKLRYRSMISCTLSYPTGSLCPGPFLSGHISFCRNAKTMTKTTTINTITTPPPSYRRIRYTNISSDPISIPKSASVRGGNIFYPFSPPFNFLLFGDAARKRSLEDPLWRSPRTRTLCILSIPGHLPNAVSWLQIYATANADPPVWVILMSCPSTIPACFLRSTLSLSPLDLLIYIKITYQ